MSSWEAGCKVAGRYEVRSVLGRGAMGIVYRAHDPVLEREVAIKTVRLDALDAAGDAGDFRARFLREARAAARLSHPNIVAVFDAGEHEGALYMAIELVEGGSVAQRLREPEPLSLPACLDIAIQVCDGLEEAHARGIVHRDIKPANLMLTRKGTVKIADFGIARIESTATLSVEGAAIGTPSYMAPEQLSGQPIDGRADVFAAGAVLYEMATGQKAFDGASVSAIVLKVMTGEPQPMRQRNQAIPPGLEAVVTRAMAKDAAQRYPSMAALRAALVELRAAPAAGTAAPAAPAAPAALAHEPVTHLALTLASPAPAPARAPVSAGKRRLRPALVAAGLGTALIALAAVGGGLLRTPVPAAPAAPVATAVETSLPAPAPAAKPQPVAEPGAVAKPVARLALAAAPATRMPSAASDAAAAAIEPARKPAAPAVHLAGKPLDEDLEELRLATTNLPRDGAARGSASPLLASAEAALRRSGDRAGFYLELGRYYAQLGKVHAAADLLERASALAPDRRDVLEALAGVYDRLPGARRSASRVRERLERVAGGGR